MLHKLYFASLGGESEPKSALREALTRDFGSVDHWREEFSAIGKAQGGGGPGWVLLTWSRRDGKLVNQCNGFTVAALLTLSGAFSGLGYHGWYSTETAFAASAQEKAQAHSSLNQVPLRCALSTPLMLRAMRLRLIASLRKPNPTGMRSLRRSRRARRVKLSCCSIHSVIN